MILITDLHAGSPFVFQILLLYWTNMACYLCHYTNAIDLFCTAHLQRDKIQHGKWSSNGTSGFASSFAALQRPQSPVLSVAPLHQNIPVCP